MRNGGRGIGRIRERGTERGTRAILRHMTYYNLRDAMTEPGCPICRLVNDAVARYLETFLYENVNDPGMRVDLRRSNGFCPDHAGLLREHGDPLGHAIIYGDLVDHVLESLEGLLWACGSGSARLPATGTVASLADDLLPGRRCPACLVAREAEQRYIEVLIAELGSMGDVGPGSDPRWGTGVGSSAGLGSSAQLGSAACEFGAGLERALTSSDGLCLSHLAQALKASRHRAAATRLLRASIAKLEELKAQLAEIRRKHDYRFSGGPWGAEKDAWARAAALWSGHPAEKGQAI
ncbi:MAG: DUF6062 family protein [Clostridia bacterium]